MGYFHQIADVRPARRLTLDHELIDVLSATNVPESLRPRAVSLGVGSALSSPHLLQQDLVNFYSEAAELERVAGPATAALLGGSISADGEVEATGVTFSTSGGILGFMTFAIPAALLVPGGGFLVAWGLYRMVRNAGALHQYARVSRAAPHIAAAVVMSDNRLTRDEARLIRDLVRGRVGSPAERHDILEADLDPSAKQQASFTALERMDLSPQDWPALLSIAIAAAHADDDYGGEEQAIIQRFRTIARLSETEFLALAAEAEVDYLNRRHLGEAAIRACYQLACAGEGKPPQDAELLLDLVMCAAVPSDAEREELAATLRASDGRTAMSRDELVEGASKRRPSLFRRAVGARSESSEWLLQAAQTLALFVATLEQWRGAEVPSCRAELLAIGSEYGWPSKRMHKWLRRSHKNIDRLRKRWVAPAPWEGDADEAPAVVTEHVHEQGAFVVTSLAGGRFRFHRGARGWEWHSAELEFDRFVTRVLDLEVTELTVHTDDATFELLAVTVDAHDSGVVLKRREQGG